MDYTRDLLMNVLEMLRDWRSGGVFDKNEYAKTLMQELVKLETIWPKKETTDD